MPRPRSNKPGYCYHKTSGRAYVRINGVQHWLGQYGTAESRDRYDALVGQWIAQGRPATPTGSAHKPASDLLVLELVDTYWEFAKSYYKAGPGGSDGHLASLRGALRLLVRLYGEVRVAEFGPLKLTVVLEEMVKEKTVRQDRRVPDPQTGETRLMPVDVPKSGWTRGYANAQLKRLKRMFCWGVARELVNSQVYQALDAVGGLRKGKTAARESQPVRPAPDTDVTKVLPLLPPQVKTIIELQALTGMRPGEARIMRGCDIDRSGDIWVYRPQWHKTEHHGQGHVREIRLGPKAQELLQPYLNTLDYLFRPEDADAYIREQKRAARKTPMTPSQARRQSEAAGRRRSFQPFYTKDALARCVKRACRKAGLQKSFTPNMLRHAAATLIRRKYGIEAARLLLGHRHIKTTEIYAEADQSRASEIMKEVG